MPFRTPEKPIKVLVEGSDNAFGALAQKLRDSNIADIPHNVDGSLVVSAVHLMRANEASACRKQAQRFRVLTHVAEGETHLLEIGNFSRQHAENHEFQPRIT